MTAKRFTSQRTDDYNFSDILDNGKWIGICHVDCEDDFVNKFNELADENEQLKSFKSRVFNLLQDEIREESELLDYYLKEKAPCNADRQQIIIGVLKRLQKELEE